MKTLVENELKMTYDDISDDLDLDENQNDSERFEIPAYKPLSNLVLDFSKKDRDRIYENETFIDPGIVAANQKLASAKDSSSEQNSSFNSNNIPPELIESNLQPIDDNNQLNTQAPAYKLPSSNLNLPMFNPGSEQTNDTNLQVKFNSKEEQNSNIVASLNRSRLGNQEKQSNKESGSDLSAESRRKIDEVKAKLDALSKKFAIEGG